MDIKPITQLSKITDLALIYAPFINEADQLLFQQLRLISLNLVFSSTLHFPNSLLEVIRSHAMGIQDMSLCFGAEGVSLDWTPLPAFSNLTSLFLSAHNVNGSLSEALEQMCGLSRMSLLYFGDHGEEIFTSVLSLSGLSSLRLDCGPVPKGSDFGPHYLDNLS